MKKDERPGEEAEGLAIKAKDDCFGPDDPELKCFNGWCTTGQRRGPAGVGLRAGGTVNTSRVEAQG